jgi:hypothetical protein
MGLGSGIQGSKRHRIPDPGSATLVERGGVTIPPTHRHATIPFPSCFVDSYFMTTYPYSYILLLGLFIRCKFFPLLNQSGAVMLTNYRENCGRRVKEEVEVTHC